MGRATSTSATIRWGRTTSGGCTAPAAGSGSGCAATRARTRSSAAPRPARRCREPRRDAALPPARRRDRRSRAAAARSSSTASRYEGFAGDTLASALLANGVHLVGRSFKYHRPRGIVGAGVDEPNALVQLGARRAHRAQRARDHAGALRRARRREPELLAVACASTSARSTISLSRLIPAGFYYKTFMWPPTPKWWLRYEHVIRRAAGMGRAASAARSRCLRAPVRALRRARDRRRARGPRRRARRGARRRARGALRRESGLRRQPARRRRDDRRRRAPRHGSRRPSRELAAHPDVTLLPRTTAFGCYDGNLVGLIERVTDHLAAPAGVRCRASACGRCARKPSCSRPARTSAASPTRTTTCRARCSRAPRAPTSSATRCAPARAPWCSPTTTARTRRRSRCTARASRSPRSSIRASGRGARRRAAARGARRRPADRREVRRSSARTARCASPRSTSRRWPAARVRRIECDLVALSGGWNPAVHLYSQARGKLRYDDALATFVPDGSPSPITPAGAANGRFDLAGALAEGHAAGVAAAARAGFAPAIAARAAACRRRSRAGAPQPLWSVPARTQGRQALRRLQNDVTVDDIALAAREGYRSVEHLKRYTTLGMGTDQGKLSNIVGLALLAERLGAADSAGRHDDVPAALHAGRRWARSRASTPGAHVEPTRYSAMHDWHVAHGARFVNAGLWKRPHSYPRAGESADDAALREARNVRTNVGVVDVSTLGKIELQGRDVAEFLNRVYINRWDTLAVGRCRYGVMLRDDGMVFDDGTTSRLAPSHYLMTTTTVNAVKVHAAPRDAAAGRLAGARGLRDVGDRAVGRRRAVRARARATCSRRSSTSTCRTTPSRFSRSARAACARPPASFPPGSSG